MHTRKYKTKSGAERVEVSVPHPTEPGKRVWATGKGIREAKANLEVKLEDIKKGVALGKTRWKTGEYLRDWIKTYKRHDIATSTYESYEFNINKHIAPYFEDVPLQKLSSRDIQKFITDKLENGRLDGKGGLNPKTVRYFIRILDMALGQAEGDIIPKNPCRKIVLPETEKYKPRVYNESQVMELFSKVTGTGLELPVYLGASLGLRRSEVLGLQWDMVNLKQKTLTVSRAVVRVTSTQTKKPKSKSSERVLPLPQNVFLTLKAEKKKQAGDKLSLGPAYQDNNLVICEEDGSPINPTTLSTRFKAFIKRSNLPPITFHGLRHSVATLLLKNKVDPKTIAGILGHSDTQMLFNTYSHVLKDMLEGAVATIDQMYNSDKMLDKSWTGHGGE